MHITQFLNVVFKSWIWAQGGRRHDDGVGRIMWFPEIAASYFCFPIRAVSRMMKHCGCTDGPANHSSDWKCLCLPWDCPPLSQIDQYSCYTSMSLYIDLIEHIVLRIPSGVLSSSSQQSLIFFLKPSHPFFTYSFFYITVFFYLFSHICVHLPPCLDSASCPASSSSSSSSPSRQSSFLPVRRSRPQRSAGQRTDIKYKVYSSQLVPRLVGFSRAVLTVSRLFPSSLDLKLSGRHCYTSQHHCHR